MLKSARRGRIKGLPNMSELSGSPIGPWCKICRAATGEYVRIFPYPPLSAIAIPAIYGFELVLFFLLP